MDKGRFADWLVEIKDAFAKEENKKDGTLLLSAAVPASTFLVEGGYDVNSVCASLDFVNLMAFDLHGPWVRPRTTGHHAGLFKFGKTEMGIDDAVNAWISRSGGGVAFFLFLR